MRYILMSHVDGAALRGVPPEVFASAMESFAAFTTALAESGVLQTAEQLQSVETATTVRVRDEQTLLTDGPHADVPESFGGFWVVEAADLDTVLEYAAGCPAAAFGSVEVRPLVELSQ